MKEKQGSGRPGMPYLHHRHIELLGILSPSILITLTVVVLFSSQSWRSQNTLPAWMWLAVVVGIDVAHVWSTLFRSYLSPEVRALFRPHLTLIPIACWTVGVVLYSFGSAVFWTVFAYLAVFHFIRQQYGLFALYARNIRYPTPWSRRIDVALVYLAAIYPLTFWHLHLPRNFDWFVEGDFIIPVTPTVHSFVLVTYILVITLQLASEIRYFGSQGIERMPKNLVVWGTVVSWYVGIVYFNSDIPFTLTNVVAHGIPYITLVWIFSARECGKLHAVSSKHRRTHPLQSLFSTASPVRLIMGVVVFLLGIFVLAYIEEALWDSIVWRDHRAMFAWAWHLPRAATPEVLTLVVPLLAIPQATHYVLDGFIWRIRQRSPGDQRVLSL